MRSADSGEALRFASTRHALTAFAARDFAGMAAQAADKPDILVIMAGDVGWIKLKNLELG